MCVYFRTLSELVVDDVFSIEDYGIQKHFDRARGRILRLGLRSGHSALFGVDPNGTGALSEEPRFEEGADALDLIVSRLARLPCWPVVALNGLHTP